MKESLTLSESEFSKAIGVSPATVYRLRKAGKLSHLRIRGVVRYLPRHVDEFLTASEVSRTMAQAQMS